jgi:hypothetical protein
MTTVVLRVRLVGGENMDVTYEGAEDNDAAVIEQVVRILSQDAGVLRTEHGGRLVVLFGRGVAAIEVAPRGAVV